MPADLGDFKGMGCPSVHFSAYSFITFLWFPCIYGQITQEIDLKLGGHIRYGSPQAWLTIGHTLLIHAVSWPVIGQSVSMDFRTNCWGIDLKLSGYIHYGTPWACLIFDDDPLNSCCCWPMIVPLQWRHNEPDGVSNHQPHHCLHNRLFRCRSKKTSKLCVTGLCAWNSPMTGEFPVQMASNTENVSIWWRRLVVHLNLHPLKPCC